MPETAVLITYLATYGAIVGYAAWLEVRRRRLSSTE
jgi:hypothetical protein